MSDYTTDALWRNLPTVTATMETADIDLRAPAKTNKDVNERYSLPGTPIFLVEGLPQSGVTRVWMKNTGISEPMQSRIHRCCVENALRRLAADDPTLSALHWFGTLARPQSGGA